MFSAILTAMAFSDPEKNIEQLGLSEGAVVADLGTGSGFYALAASKAVGDSGKVLAVEIQQEVLARVVNMAKAAGLKNMEFLHGDIEENGCTKIGDNVADVAIVANVLFQVEDKVGLVNETKRILKSSGRVLVVDWKESFGGLGPQTKDVVTEATAEDLFEKAGFVFVKEIAAGDHHYGLILRKP